VIQRLDPPVRAPHAQPSRDDRLVWTAAQIDQTWRRAGGPATTTWQSPRIDVEPDDLRQIAVRLSPSAAGERAVLMWSATPELSREDYLRNRRDLSPGRDAATVVFEARELRRDGHAAIRYLFLHVPGTSAAAAGIESVEIRRTADLQRLAPVAWTPIVVGGEVREGITTAGGGVTFRTDVPPRAELAFGVHVTGADRPVRITVRLTRAGRAHDMEAVVEPGGWRDVRLALPASGAADLTLSLQDGAPAVHWSRPVLLAPGTAFSHPNVVLYVVDTLRADRLGAPDAGPSRTPVLDQLSRFGLGVERAYATASWTKPSIASLLTSLHPPTHGLGSRYYSDPLPEGVPTLAGVLAGAGYVTAQFSANAFAGAISSLDRGFDRSLMPAALAPAATDAGSITAADLNDRVLPWLDAHRDVRFFLYVQSIDAHPPFTVAGATPRDAYDASVAFNDREIGRLYERLEALGLAADTLFIVTSDHGEAFGEHGRSGHGQSAYDEEVRVPLVLVWPARLRAGVLPGPVSLVDVMPTVLDYAGVRFDRSRLQGRSFAGGVAAPAPVYVQRFVYPADLDAADAARLEARAVVDWPWKLIVTGEAASPAAVELYDLVADPGERQDLAARRPEIASALAARLDQFAAGQAEARARFVASYGVDAPAGRPILPASDVLQQLRTLGYVAR
jgi:arylsulfatase A-like enzyme